MKYNVAVNRKYHYIKVFGVLKKTSGNPNALSAAVASFIDNLIAKNAKKAKAE